MQPLARDLLQQLPACITKFSSLQVQLAQQGTAALQLQQQHLPGYLPLLLNQQQSSASGTSEYAAGTHPIQLDAVESFGQQPLCHQLFELQLQQQGGWSVPSYCVYLHEQDCVELEAVAAAAAAASDDALTATGQQQ
jgi:hypothetical protein